MGHAPQLYIVHRMKAYQKFLRLQGLTTFLGVARAPSPARAFGWRSASSAAIQRTGFSREESAFPSWRIPAFLILADALLSLRQTDSLTAPAPFRGGITIARHVSAGSATDRDPARPRATTNPVQCWSTAAFAREG